MKVEVLLVRLILQIILPTPIFLITYPCIFLATVVSAQANQTIFRTLRVDQSGDQTCFATSNYSSISDTLRSHAHSVLQVPPLVKIHNGIYVAIDDSFGKTDMKDKILTISVLTPTSFNSSSNEAVSNLAESLTKLNSYSFNVFDDFFWTSPSTQEFFQKTSIDDLSEADKKAFRRDKKRCGVWKKLSNSIGAANITSDPCRFKKAQITTKIVSNF
jgi:hypothetical protein